VVAVCCVTYVTVSLLGPGTSFSFSSASCSISRTFLVMSSLDISPFSYIVNLGMFKKRGEGGVVVVVVIRRV